MPDRCSRRARLRAAARAWACGRSNGLESSCGHTPTPSSRRKRCSRSFISATCSAVTVPRAMSGWLVIKIERESGLAQAAAGFAYAGQQPQLGERRRRVWLALPDDGAVHHAIAIQKHSAAHSYILPNRASASMDCNAAQSAWRVLRLQVQPRLECDPCSGEPRERRLSSRDRRRCIPGAPGLRKARPPRSLSFAISVTVM